ncbi:putative natural product biosynthesis protein [Pseudomonas lopnurensis]|uniref:putative natural product biosynthesis protein n=1 Tax=Pseudomonas lopnurensis TaxID=1477517 RepID=UPI00187A4C54|nr:putative natural product biosynthesis protein [Pseudomonas lopnurensis]MBE7375122.1 putative natural product biosynthesis protein [Pseudomonas lopnurensis]
MTMMERFARAEGRISYRLPFPDYPSNARSFVHLDAKLLPYWHALFDVCPRLLKLDPPDGLNIFRAFMTWAYARQLALNWTFHLGVCRWLLISDYRERVDQDHIEAMLIAAAARWVGGDDSPALGIVLGWRGSSEHVFDWKPRVRQGARPFAAEEEELPPPPWDFAWSPLSGTGGNGFRRWLRVP